MYSPQRATIIKVLKYNKNSIFVLFYVEFTSQYGSLNCVLYYNYIWRAQYPWLCHVLLYTPGLKLNYDINGMCKGFYERSYFHVVNKHDKEFKQNILIEWSISMYSNLLTWIKSGNNLQ